MPKRLGIHEIWIDGKQHHQVREYPGGRVVDTFPSIEKAQAFIDAGGKSTTAKKSRKKSTKGKKK